jgi:Protein of unknown function (DUF4197)
MDAFDPVGEGNSTSPSHEHHDGFLQQGRPELAGGQRIQPQSERKILVITRLIVFVMGIGVVMAPASGQVEKFLKGMGIGQESGLSNAKVSAGLKEALQVATEESIELTGRPNGYFSNAAIKILMPEKLRTVEQGLRMVGYGPQVDEFVLSMNRAAEQSAPAAKQIFLDAIAGYQL